MTLASSTNSLPSSIGGCRGLRLSMGTALRQGGILHRNSSATLREEATLLGAPSSLAIRSSSRRRCILPPLPAATALLLVHSLRQ
mmetsp:Transcript_1572/g.5545  ORF Transcript_1572/g.5545 Transcript_1572/m.5545 type:complete len:85 (-) Transcript_1572:268-522(-)